MEEYTKMAGVIIMEFGEEEAVRLGMIRKNPRIGHIEATKKGMDWYFQTEERKHDA